MRMELDDVWTSECCFSSDTKTAKAKLPIWLISRELAMLYSKEGGQKYIVKVRECQLPHYHAHHYLLGVHHVDTGNGSPALFSPPNASDL